MAKPERSLPDADTLARGVLAAAGLAVKEADLPRCVGESGILVLGVEIRLDRGRIVTTDAGVGFRRRVF